MGHLHPREEFNQILLSEIFFPKHCFDDVCWGFLYESSQSRRVGHHEHARCPRQFTEVILHDFWCTTDAQIQLFLPWYWSDAVAFKFHNWKKSALRLLYLTSWNKNREFQNKRMRKLLDGVRLCPVDVWSGPVSAPVSILTSHQTGTVPDRGQYVTVWRDLKLGLLTSLYICDFELKLIANFHEIN